MELQSERRETVGTAHASGVRVTLQACDICGSELKLGAHRHEVTCGDCRDEQARLIAHTVCARCTAAGADVVDLAVRHQVLRHGLPASALTAETLAFSSEVSRLFSRLVDQVWGVHSRSGARSSFRQLFQGR
jgi:hypothetical protein